MTAMVWPYFPGFSVRFDPDRQAWGIQDAAPGFADGRWVSDERWGRFTDANAVKQQLVYRSYRSQPRAEV